MAIHTLKMFAPGKNRNTSEPLKLTPETELWEGSQNIRVLDELRMRQTWAEADLTLAKIDRAIGIITKYLVAQVGDYYRAYTYSPAFGWLTLRAGESGIHTRPVEQDTIHDVSMVIGFNKAIQPTAMQDQEYLLDIEKAMLDIVETEPAVEKSISETLDELSQFQNTHPGDTGRVPSVEEQAANASLRTQQSASTKTPQETWTPQLGMFVNVVGHEEFNPKEVFIIEDCTWVTKCAYLRYTLRPLNSEKPYVDVRAAYVKPFKVPL